MILSLTTSKLGLEELRLAYSSDSDENNTEYFIYNIYQHPYEDEGIGNKYG